MFHLAFSQYLITIVRLYIWLPSVRRYVIMPDHVHLFVRISIEYRLGTWMKGLKRHISKKTNGYAGKEISWQPGFFDHLLRNSESYVEKSKYVLMNPVRAGLVNNPDEWPYKGEIMCVYMA